jgi:hypothetical protein
MIKYIIIMKLVNATYMPTLSIEGAPKELEYPARILLPDPSAQPFIKPGAGSTMTFMSQTAGKIVQWSVVIIILMGVFVGLLGWTQSAGAIAAKDGIDFMWQIVLLGFVIGAGLLSLKTNVHQRETLRDSGIGAMLSSVLMIIGYGVAMAGFMYFPTYKQVYVSAGTYVFFDGGVFLMSFCIAASSFELLKILWPRLKRIIA